MEKPPVIDGSTWLNPYQTGKREIGIFELSDLFGITSETLRKYEKKKILQPRRNKSGYRSYGTWELTKIVRTRQMRQEGFSLGTIAEKTVNELPSIIADIEQKQKELLWQIEYNKKLIRWLGCQKEKQLAFDAQGDKLLIEHTPEWHCCVYMVDDSLAPKEGRDRENLKAWLSALPFFHVFYIGNLKQGMVSCLVLSREEKETFGLQSLVPDFIVPQQLCITLTATAEHSETYDSSNDIIRTSHERAKEMNVATADFNLIQMIRFTQTGDLFRSHNKVYIPVKNE